MKDISKLYDEAREIQLEVIDSLKTDNEYLLEISIDKLIDVLHQSRLWVNFVGKAASVSDINLAKAITKIVDDVTYKLEYAEEESF